MKQNGMTEYKPGKQILDSRIGSNNVVLVIIVDHMVNLP